MSIGAILSKVLPLCEPKPSEAEKLRAAADRARTLVKKHVASNNKVLDVIFGGSFAKGTWLRGDADVDIFVKIDQSVDIQKFEEMGKQIGLESLKEYRRYLRYSDHPYVEAFVNGVRVNVVPCYDVEKGKWKSAADRSPFHTQYVMKNLDDEKKRQVRLLKKFLKCTGVYGAEIAIGGFSGYVSEILVLRYGSFENVLRAMADIKEKEVISVDDMYDRDVVKGFQSPVIIIDPVDSRRNLGTAISPESAGKFVLAARAFLEKPSPQFFKEEKRKGKSPLYKNLLVIEFKHRERSPDIIWGQLKRSLNAIAKQLELADFTVFRSGCVTDEKNSAALVFLLESISLPAYTRRKGPAVFRGKDSASFISKSRGAKSTHTMWVDREMRVSALATRKATDAKKFVRSLLLTDKISNSGVTKGLFGDIQDRKHLHIYSGNERKIKGIAKEAADELVLSERLIF